jgi:hypothetical protein
VFSYYLIVEHHHINGRSTTSWRVTRTKHCLENEADLLVFLKELEAEFGPNFVLTYWRRLRIPKDKKPT